MSRLPGRAWSGKNHSSMGSNVYTTQMQGGGDKKAGFPYQIGRSWRSSIALDSTDPIAGKCCKLGSMQITMFPKTSISKPIGSSVRPNTYWKIPGVGN